MSEGWLQFLALSLISLTAAAHDVAYRKIPNWLSVVAAVTGLAAISLWQGGEALLSHGAHMLFALVAGMVLFRLGVLGGGDAKLYAGLAAWFPLTMGLPLVVTVTVSGLILFLLWALVRMIMGKRLSRRSDSVTDKFPYALAIAAGTLLTALPRGWP